MDFSATPSPKPGHLTLYRHPFTADREQYTLSPDQSLGESLQAQGYRPEHFPYLSVCIDGVPVPPERWQWMRPNGELVTVKLVPRGGGGPAKSIFKIVAGIALLVVPGMQAFGIGMILSGVTGLIAPKPNQRNFSPQSKTNNEERLVSSITGIQNQENRYGAIPKVYGTHRLYPPLAARSYTEIAGRDQYLRMVFVVGYKPLDISDLRIGTTPIASFQDVETEIHSKDSDPAITLYTNSIIEESLSVLLTQAGSWQQRTSAVNADELSVDVTFQRGLVNIDSQGVKQSRSVDWDIEYRKVGVGSWTAVASKTTTDQTASVVRATHKWAVSEPGEQYEVRLRRTTADTTDTQIADEITWTVLRTIREVDVVNRDDVALVALRIRANEQLNGVVQSFNCLAQGRVQVYNGASWAEAQTNLAAWAYVDVLTGSGSYQPLALSRINADAMKAWADADTADGREFNKVYDDTGTVFQTLQEIAAAGRASFHIQDGLYTVVRDIPQATPVTMITPRNSWDYSGQIRYPNNPHALRVQFVNKDEEYQQEERIVYDDGYDVNNATKFETLPLIGCTDKDQAWKMGRYHLVASRLRPETHTVMMDVEHIAFNRGDRVLLSQPAALIGISVSRITAVQTSGTDVTGVTVDNPVVMESGKNYGLEIRKIDSVILQEDINLNVGEQSTVVFTTAIPNTNPQPEVGDLCPFGESGLETLDCVVKAIEPVTDMAAKITLLNYAPEIQDADTGTIPNWVPQITAPPQFIRETPPVPVVEKLNSDEFVMEFAPDGSLRSRIVAQMRLPGGFSSLNKFYQGQIRNANSGQNWNATGLFPADSGEVVFDNVRDGVTYEIRFRSSDGFGLASEWTTSTNHLVIGKTNPPPDVTTFQVNRMPDGTRLFTWTMSTIPPDLAGYQIRYKAGTGGTWATMADLHTGLLGTSPYENGSSPSAGTFTIGIKAVDTSGNESVNAKILEVTLGSPRIGGGIVNISCRGQGFPGTKTDCYIEESGDLVATGTKTWDDFFTDGVDWDNWTSWNRVPTSPIVYEHTPIDLGAILSYQLIVNVTGDGTPTITEAHSDDDVTYSSFAAISGSYSARYIKVKVSMAGADPRFVDVNIIPDGTVVQEEIADLDTSTISSPTGDLRLPIVKSYTVITSVQVAFQNVGAGWSWEVIDKSASLGPRIKIYNASDTLADCTIDAVIRGFE